MIVPYKVRRKLRMGLGTRVLRRAGTSVPKAKQPRQLLADQIEKWKRSPEAAAMTRGDEDGYGGS